MTTANEDADTTKQQHIQSKPPKQGHKCLGCICDTKRSVVLIQFVFGIVLNTVGIVIAALVEKNEMLAHTTHNDDFEDHLDVDNQENDANHYNNYYATKANTIFYLVGIAIAVFVIIGAITYNIWLVATGILWSVIHAAFYIACACREYHYYHSSAAFEAQRDENTRYLILQVIVPIAIVGFVNYPQAVFIYEVMAGIMGPDMYDEKEKYSCSCI